MRRMGEIALEVPGVANVVQFPGLNAVHFVATPNAGVMFVGLEEPGERELEAGEIAMRINMGSARSRKASPSRCCRRPCSGSATPTASSSTSRTAAALGYGELYTPDDGVHRRARPDARASTRWRLSRPTSRTSRSSTPCVDRTKVKELGLALTDVFNTLQVYLGSAYVNDFNLFGRTYQVYAQADAPYRATVEDIEGLKVRNERGEMVPLGSVVDIEPSYGPDPVIRYNAYPAADMSAGLNPAVLSSTDALAQAARDGRAGAAARHGDRVDRPHLPAGHAGQHGAVRVPAVRAARLPRALRALRELVAAARDHPDRAAVPAVRDRRHLAHQLHPRAVARGLAARLRADLPRQQHLHEDRARRADRPRLQERDPDRRVRARPRGSRARASSMRRSRPAGCGCGRS